MTNFGKLIHDRRLQLDMTLEQVGNIVGVGKSTVRKWEQGSITNVKRDKLVLLAKALQMDPSALIYDDPLPAPNLFRPEFHRVPILGTIACGEPILAEDNLEGYANVAEIRCDFALRCKGDSMTPKFMDGDLVLIRQQPDVEDGQIAAVRIEDEATLKHVYHTGDGVMLTAENSAYPPMMFRQDTFSRIAIIGLAVGYLRLI